MSGINVPIGVEDNATSVLERIAKSVERIEKIFERVAKGIQKYDASVKKAADSTDKMMKSAEKAAREQIKTETILRQEVYKRQIAQEKMILQHTKLQRQDSLEALKNNIRIREAEKRGVNQVARLENQATQQRLRHENALRSILQQRYNIARRAANQNRSTTIQQNRLENQEVAVKQRKLRLQLSAISLQNRTAQLQRKILQQSKQKLIDAQKFANAVRMAHNPYLKIIQAGRLIKNNLTQQNSLYGRARVLVGAIHTAITRKSKAISTAKRYQQEFNTSLHNGRNAANGLLNNMKALVATYVGMRGISAVVGQSDTNTSTLARLDLINDGTQTTAELQNKVFKAAEETRGSYTDMVSSVAKLGVSAGKQFKDNDEIIDYVSTLNKMFVVSGTEAHEVSATMLQLTQAMSSGKLQGEEFRSVMEHCPMIVEAITDYLGISEDKLYEMKKDGELTGKVLKESVLAYSEKISEKFEKMPYTWAQIWNSIKNGYMKVMQPVFDKINKFFNKNRSKFLKFGEMVSRVVVRLSEKLLKVTEAFVDLADSKEVEIIFNTLVDVFTMTLQIIADLLPYLGKFLKWLKDVGALEPTVKALSWGILAFVFVLGPLCTLLSWVIMPLFKFGKAIWWVLQILFKFGGWILKFPGWLWGAFTKIGAAIGVGGGWILAAVLVVLFGIINNWEGFKNAVIKHGQILWNQLKHIGNGIANVFRWLRGDLDLSFSEIVAGFGKWVWELLTLGAQCAANMLNICAQIMQGLIDGIKSLLPDLQSLVDYIFDLIWGDTSDAFVICSPSKKMEELGRYVTEGFNIGLEKPLRETSGISSRIASSTVNGTAKGTVIKPSPTNVTINVNNTITGEADAKKVVDKITFMLREAMDTSAKGVYGHV